MKLQNTLSLEPVYFFKLDHCYNNIWENKVRSKKATYSFHIDLVMTFI